MIPYEFKGAGPGRARCNLCRNSFDRKSILNNHITEKHGISPENVRAFLDAGGTVPRTRRANTSELAVCKICERGFAKQGELNTHLRNKHALFPDRGSRDYFNAGGTSVLENSRANAGRPVQGVEYNESGKPIGLSTQPTAMRQSNDSQLPPERMVDPGSNASQYQPSQYQPQQYQPPQYPPSQYPPSQYPPPQYPPSQGSRTQPTAIHQFYSSQPPAYYVTRPPQRTADPGSNTSQYQPVQYQPTQYQPAQGSSTQPTAMYQSYASQPRERTTDPGSDRVTRGRKQQ